MLGSADLLANAKLIIDSWLFESAYYLSQSGEEHSHSVRPIVHYLSFGRDEGWEPHPLSDTSYYLAQLGESIEDIHSLIHYIKGGAANQTDPHPLFDSKYYLSQAGDISASGLTPLGHFLSEGAARHLNPNPFFDVQFYCSQVPELKINGMNPLVHYLLIGAANRLDPGPHFQTSYYLEKNPKLLDEGINPLAHFLVSNREQGRSFRLFPFASGDASDSDLIEDRSGWVRSDVYERLRKIEPMLPAPGRLGILPALKTPTRAHAGRAYFDFSRTLVRPFSHLLLVPSISSGRMSEFLPDLRTLVDAFNPDAPLVVFSDGCTDELLSRIPSGVRFVVLDSLKPSLNEEEKLLLLCRLIVQARPHSVMNLGSNLGWKLFERFGKPLCTVTHLTAILQVKVSEDEKPLYEEALQSLNLCIDDVASVVIDSEQTRVQLIERFAFTDTQKSKFVVGFNPLVQSDILFFDSGNSIEGVEPIGLNGSDRIEYDISLVVNAHAEGRLLHPTVKSAVEAIHCAQQEGLNVELLIVLDNADEETICYCQNYLPSNARLLEVSNSDPGLSRNDAVLSAKGECIAFLDGDDLISRNWLVLAHKLIAGEKSEVILHPSVVVYFEESENYWCLRAQDEIEFPQATLFEHNLWPALSFARRSTYRKVPFRATRIELGLGFEDWLFNCDSVASGMVHKIVPQTLHCLRKKKGKISQLKRTIAVGCTIADSPLFAFPWERMSGKH